MTEGNRNVCPLCLSAKEYFTGKKYIECTECDENGMVSDEVNELYCGEDDLI